MIGSLPTVVQVKSCGSSDDGNNTSSCTSGHQSEATVTGRRSESKSPEATTGSPEVKGGQIEDLKEVLLLKDMESKKKEASPTGEVTSDRGSSAASSSIDEAQSRSPPKAKNEAEETRQNVNITVNSHIPASPKRQVVKMIEKLEKHQASLAEKTDAGTQMESLKQRLEDKKDHSLTDREDKTQNKEAKSENLGNLVKEVEDMIQDVKEVKREVRTKNQMLTTQSTKAPLHFKPSALTSVKREETSNQLPVFLEEHQPRPCKSSNNSPKKAEQEAKSKIPSMGNKHSAKDVSNNKKKSTSILKKMSSLGSKSNSDRQKSKSNAKSAATEIKPKTSTNWEKFEVGNSAVGEKSENTEIKKSNSSRLSLRKAKKRDSSNDENGYHSAHETSSQNTKTKLKFWST